MLLENRALHSLGSFSTHLASLHLSENTKANKKYKRGKLRIQCDKHDYISFKKLKIINLCFLVCSIVLKKKKQTKNQPNKYKILSFTKREGEE